MKGQIPIIILVILAVSMIFVAVMYVDLTESPDVIKKFNSYQELENFVKAGSQTYSYGITVGSEVMRSTAAVAETAMAPSAQKAEESADAGAATDYSTTNIQVKGVDEPDIVKNDGKYIYTVSGNKVIIIDAYPAETAEIVSEIEFSGTPQEIFVNGDRLVVFGQEDYYSSGGIPEMGIMPRYDYSPGTFIKVFDITDRANPVSKRNVTVDGSYYDSRMIGDYVYVIANEYIYYGGEPIPMPVVRSGTAEKTIAATDIYYFDYPDTSYNFNNIVSVNVLNDADEVKSKTLLLGYTQNLFVSQNNIYVTYTKRLSEYDFFDKIIDEAVIPSVPIDIQMKINEVRNSGKEQYEKIQEVGEIVQDYVESLGPEQGASVMKSIQEKYEKVQADIAKEIEKTIAHKIAIGSGSIEYVTSGEIPGNVLNQFSMDEYNGYFRIATTTGNWRSESLNHVYVLDSNMQIVGRLEDLAHGERIYSARFMGDKAYLVTFRQIDPLFVIDMSNPTSPQVLGFLKVPGVSDYLHPYDETHIIGVGRNATEQGRISGLKLALFDVSDFANPREMSTYVIGGDNSYASSDALYDHKAFLFNKEKQLLVIPVSLNTYSAYDYDQWQGAYVFNIDLANGLTLKGKVTHANETESSEEYYYDWNAQIRRSLYIDNVLYTVSKSMVKANSLFGLEELSKIELSNEAQGFYSSIRVESSSGSTGSIETVFITK